ncbi:MAG: glycosyltransferase family 39 protein [Candidatus Aenigmarchaeota archaeon]|nr:glycosyltransferase family 39 protein [Candidatus Aenigmarchaeota archaeon]
MASSKTKKTKPRKPRSRKKTISKNPSKQKNRKPQKRKPVKRKQNSVKQSSRRSKSRKIKVPRKIKNRKTKPRKRKESSVDLVKSISKRLDKMFPPEQTKSGKKPVELNNAIIFLSAIIILSLLLNMTGITWGLPNGLHPDGEHITNILLKMKNNMDLNPHNFQYPSLHYYVLLLIVTLFELTIGNLIPLGYNQFGNTLLIMRSVSALMGTAVVFLTYFISKRVYNERVGLFSSLFVALSMGFVTLTHLTTFDVALTFWVMLTFLCCVFIMETKEWKYYALAALFAGFAASTKYTLFILFVPIIISHLLAQKYDKRKILQIFRFLFDKKILMVLALVAIGFLIGTPYSVLDNETFKTDLAKVSTVMTSWEGYKSLHIGWIEHIYNLINIVGYPLFILIIISVFYGIYTVKKKPRDRYDILFLSWIVLFYGIIGSWGTAPGRYLMPILPFLMIFSGKFTEKFIFKKKGISFRRLLVIAIIIIYSLAYVLIANSFFMYESRNAASEWIVENIPENSTIDVYIRGKYLPQVSSCFGNSVGCSLYKVTYIGEIENKAIAHDNFRNFYKDYMKNNASEYIITTSFYYRRYFLGAFEERKEFYTELFNGEFEHFLIAKFPGESIITVLFNPQLEGLNPTVQIFKKI